MISTSHETYYIEPSAGRTLTDNHYILQHSDMKHKNLTCGEYKECYHIICLSTQWVEYCVEQINSTCILGIVVYTSIYLTLYLSGITDLEFILLIFCC